MLTAEIIILIILIILSGLFSGVETAFMSVSRIKVRSLLREKKKGSQTLYRIKKNPHKLIITILIGNNLVNIGAASLATVVFMGLFGSKGVGIATGVMTFLILVFGEITPKTLAIQNAEKISLIVAKPLEILSYILTPVVVIFEGLSKLTSSMLGSEKEKKLSEEELKTIVTMGREEGILSKETAEIMQNVLKFEGTKVTEVMTPKAYIEMINGDKKLKDVIKKIIKSSYSRFPVYSKNQDEIIGILDIDDILKYLENKNLNIKIKSIMRKTFFVPYSKEIDDLLAEFEGKKVPMAIVVDEYGNVDGLITVEDILEEIVGDIFDKNRREKIYIKKVNKRLIRVDAKTSIEEINKILHLSLEKEHFETIAGFIEHHLKKIPKKGEKIRLKNVLIEVDKVTKQKIKSIKITKL